MKKIITRKNLYSVLAAVASAFMMALAENLFMQEAALLPGGFLGIATLVQMVGKLFSVRIPLNLTLLFINIPVALFCAKTISKKFVCFSLIQIVCLGLFMRVVPVHRFFEQEILNVIFGGCLYGFSTATALRGNGSTGGTDFIALYVSNKTGKEIWMQVFASNCVMLGIFGFLFGWDKAGYSVLFQFLSTRMIQTFHTRYKRVMLQIFTKRPDAVVQAYVKAFRHGITVLSGKGGYTGEDTGMLLAITSSYEMPDAIETVRKADPDVIINVTKSEQYIGKFIQPEM